LVLLEYMKETELARTENESNSSNSRSNWLRAAVLGANDGIVSIAVLLVTGVAGLIAGSLSMAVGEYVSVSSQRDIEKALIEKESFALANYPEEELEELVGIYEKKGLTRSTAEMVAKELTDKDPFAAHFDVELGIDPDDLTNPTHAAYASGLAYTSGGLIPLIAILFLPAVVRIPLTFIAVLAALTLTGYLSARVGDTHKGRAILRVLVGGTIAMVVTFGIGNLLGRNVS
jgi:VIT1/CCC1 family predicted Fe2+/Mn2+ transporter